MPATPGTTAWPPSRPSRAHLARHARHFGGKRPQLIHHRVDGFLELQNFAAHVHRDLARKIAARDRRGHFGDVTHLAGKIAGHRIHRVGEIFPCARNARHLGLPAELAVRAHLARNARDLSRKDAELLNHSVHDRRRSQELAFQRPAVHVHLHCLSQIALGNGGDRARHFDGRPQQVFD